MTESVKPTRRKTQIMTTSPAYYPRSATKCVTVLTPFLRHLNTGTLAIFLFVALASLTSIRGREVEPKGSIPVEAGKNDIFFEAEDGIRDLTVTGVQTCALPI